MYRSSHETRVARSDGRDGQLAIAAGLELIPVPVYLPFICIARRQSKFE
jgi:hypothetical protein